MSQTFYKGRTNNHLTFVMVDATDFASAESALSAAIKIKIYGKLRTATGVNFVTSGAGSLTNDIQHVGASALGIYTIALAKADLSDASAAWYDQYIISLSATGAAYQTMVIDGEIDQSAFSDVLSNAYSAAAQANSRILVLSGVVSDLYSLLSDHHSDFQSRVPKLVATNSQVSDLHSDLRSYLVLMSDVLSDLQSDFQSRVPKLVATNSQVSDLVSDLRSYLVVMSGVQSDIYSALSDFQSDFGSRVPKLVATNSQLSDLASDVKSAVLLTQSLASDAASAAIQANSRVLALSDAVSNVYSLLSDHHSDFQSRVPKRVATDSQLSDVLSDIRSAIAGITVVVSASDISDIASAVWADTIGARVDSRVLVAQSYLSDIRSHISDLQSDFQSRVPKRVATDSYLSDVHSDLKSAIAGITVTLSASDISDIASAVVAGVPVAPIYSLLSDLNSNFQSRVPKLVATNSQLSDLASDLKSAVGNITVTIGASDISDIASAVVAGLPVTSMVSDIYSLLSNVKATTDKFTFDADNCVDVNVQKINDTELTGDGTVGTPWGPV